MDCNTWPVPESGECVSGCDIPAGTDPLVLESAAVQAGIILRILSGGRAGTCVDVLRPLPECPVCGADCRCVDAGDRIRLYASQGPVTGVSEVRVDGSVVTDWAYWPSGQWLYRVPPALWPRSDKKWATPGSLEVDVTVGYELDAWALAVHAELTCELVRACSGLKCRLPRNATQVSAQGITVQLSTEDIKQLLPSVAAWVAAVNPDKAQAPSRLYSPDLHRGPGGGCSGC